MFSDFRISIHVLTGTVLVALWQFFTPTSTRAWNSSQRLSRLGNLRDRQLERAWRTPYLPPPRSRYPPLRLNSVQFLKAAMRVGKARRQVHASADDLNIGARFTLAGRFHRGVELAERLNAGGHPVGASQRAR